MYTLLVPIRHVLHAINQKKCTISIFPRMAFAEFFGNLQHLKNFWVRSFQLQGWATYHTYFQSTAGLRPTLSKGSQGDHQDVMGNKTVG